jgi:hypothetical protein
MCRFRNALLLVVLCWCAVSPALASPADERVERYLESRRLDSILARQLLDRVEAAEAREREQIVRRLADIYVRLIERAQTREERARWRGAATELLRAAGESLTLDVRLKIRRAEYTAAERLAERWRMALGDVTDKEEAVEILRAVADDLARVGAEADRMVLRLQRDEERTSIDERPLLAQLLSDARETRSLSFYLAGWSNAYLAYLQGTPARAEEAIRNLGWLLGANPGQPATIARAPTGLFRYDHVARSAIGVAWCQALLGRASDSSDWFRTIEGAEEVAPAALEALALWRVVCFAALDDWPGVRSMSAEASGAMEQLIAAMAFDAVAGSQLPDPIALTLRDQSIGALVASGNLAQVVALGRRYGLSSLGDEGFAARCVRGLTLFEEARQNEPGGARELRQAADALGYALQSDDLQAYSGAAGETSVARAQALLLAARRESGRASGQLLQQASNEFERAASLLQSSARIADALYWSIRTLDEARDLGVSAPQDRRARLVASLLDGQPDDERAGLMLVQELSDVETLDDTKIARLQRIPPASPAYDAARRLVTRTLYARFLQASSENRDWAALRYADAAEPVLAEDVSAAAAGDAEAGSRALTRARRVLAAILDTTVPDSHRARRVLALVDRLEELDVQLDAEVRLELRYREAQVALSEGRMADAEGALAELAVSGEAGQRFADALRGATLRQAVIAWENARRENAPSGTLVLAARRAVEIGGSRLEGMAPAEALALQATLAQAAADIWRETGDETARTQAIAWLKEVHAAGIINDRATRLLAQLAEESADLTGARDAWRDLAAALQPSAPAWFEARYQFMRLMVATEPVTARTLLRQHAVLYPEFGPAPWGERIGELYDAAAAGEGATP